MKTYIYTGPVSGVTLNNGITVLLHPGETVMLPENHEYVKTLIARKHLMLFQSTCLQRTRQHNDNTDQKVKKSVTDTKQKSNKE